MFCELLHVFILFCQQGENCVCYLVDLGIVFFLSYFERSVVGVISQVTLRLERDIPDSQLYPSNLYLINDVEDNLVFQLEHFFNFENSYVVYL